MIKRNAVRESETREQMRGGPGRATIKHYFKKDEINAKCRLCAELILLPGAGIGVHEHKEEDEVFIVQQGKGLVVVDGKEEEVNVGDAILTGKGASHSIKNIGDIDLKITAVIMQY